MRVVADTTVPIDLEKCREHPSGANDLWIVAMALRLNASVLTRDAGFDKMPGVDVIHYQESRWGKRNLSDPTS